MSPLDWLGATCIACFVLACCDWWYRRLEATLTAKLKLDEAKADALDRICGRRESIRVSTERRYGHNHPQE